MTSPTITKDFLAELDNVDVGEYTYGKPTIIGSGHVAIGKYCAIAPGVEILPLGDHRWDWAAVYPFNEIDQFKGEGARIHNLPKSRRYNINIGNDVWLGYKSHILHGANVGDGAIIGAYAVVANEVKPYSVVVGNPAKEIHKRYPQEIIDVMLKIKWWDWPDDVVVANLGILTAPPDVGKLEAVWQNVQG